MSTKFLIQIHKPGRIDFAEFEKVVEEKLQKPLKLITQDERNFAGSGE